ncbi:YjgN family protein [uncultured Nitrospira sp.]|uniref:YjgN family protein n=1 Tax=uncultured Nitrospira sp. TaxID=157176 RepID=UPI0031401DB0
MELTPALFCTKCGTVRNGGGTCSQCGTARHSPKQESVNNSNATDRSLTPSESQDPLIPNWTGPSTEHGFDLAYLGSAQRKQTEALHEIPPSDIDNESDDSDLFPIHHPIFWGRGRTLFGIFIVNTFFTLLTLGLYSFWGRVRIRQFLCSQTSFAHIRFSYHGTPHELLKGWSKAFLVFGLPYACLNLVPLIWDQIPTWIPNALAATMALCFIPVAVVGSQRYRLSRTSLGTIRFSFRGHVKEYMKIWVLGSLLTVLTAGIYYPFFENSRRKFLVAHTYFGNRPFTYSGTGSGLLRIYAKALAFSILIVVTLIGISAGPETLSVPAQWPSDGWRDLFFNSMFITGLLTLLLPWFYLQVAKQRYQWNHSDFGDAQLQFFASTWNLTELRITNFLMLILTFGLAWPWVQVRNLQFLYYHLTLQGPLNFQRIEQEALDASPTGEELAGYFDAGFDLG